jgi:hypothetical protein
MTGLLNPAQRNSLTVGLRVFETHLRQARAWLTSEPEQGILVSRSRQLAPDGLAAIMQQIDLALAEIAALADKFDLTPTTQDFGAVFAAQMSADWATLCDLKAAKLRRYGAVAEELTAELDPAMDTLLALASSLKQLAGDAESP